MADVKEKLAKPMGKLLSKVVMGLATRLDSVLEQSITDKIESHDFSNDIDEAVRNFDFEKSIENAVDDYNFEKAIESAVDDYDFDFSDEAKDAVGDAITDADIDGQVDKAISERLDLLVTAKVEEKMPALVRKTLIGLLDDQEVIVKFAKALFERGGE